MKIAASALTIAAALATSSHAVMINEFQPNPVGGDPDDVSVELLGTPGESFDGYLMSIEADFGAPQFVDRVARVSGTFDANGLLVVEIPDLENPSFTFVLTDSTATATTSDSVDINDAGTLSILGTVLDAIGVPDNVADEANIIGAELGGTDFVYSGDEPQLIFRDSATPSKLYAINDPAGTDAYDELGNVVAFSSFNQDPEATTFGAINPTVPEPASAALIGLGTLLISRRRR